MLLAHDLLKQGISRDKIVFALCRVGDSASEIDEARTYIKDAGYEILPGTIPEKTAYRRATDEGRALTQTRYESLNHRAEEVAQGIVDRISQLSNSTTKKKRSTA